MDARIPDADGRVECHFITLLVAGLTRRQTKGRSSPRDTASYRGSCRPWRVGRVGGNTADLVPFGNVDEDEIVCRRVHPDLVSTAVDLALMRTELEAGREWGVLVLRDLKSSVLEGKSTTIYLPDESRGGRERI